MKKQILYTMGILLCCLVILAVVDFYTKPLVAQTETQREINKLRIVMDAFEFVSVIPETLWQGFDSVKNLKGIVFKTWPMGYAGTIPLIVGVDQEGRITGMRIGDRTEGFKETEGVGSKIKEQSFTSQFIGKNVSQISLTSEGGDIEAISGATISSRAVCEATKKGLQYYLPYLSGGNREDTRRSIFPEAKIFVAMISDTLWYALSEQETLGIIFAGTAFGYLDTIKYLVGINKNGNIERVIITYSRETEGIGEQIRNPEFLDKFKSGAPDVISGATISSRALISSVKTNSERFVKFLK